MKLFVRIRQVKLFLPPTFKCELVCKNPVGKIVPATDFQM